MRVYRFHDKVAFNPDQGPTFYLTSDQARAVMRAMRGCVQDIASHTFGNSAFKTVDIEEAR